MEDSGPTAAPEWILDPDVIVFATGDRELAVGAAQQHGFGDAIGNLFGKSKETVKANWEQVVDQMRFLLTQVDAITDKYELSEITFELGFSAEGAIVFVAQAGITTTISATFKRK